MVSLGTTGIRVCLFNGSDRAPFEKPKGYSCTSFRFLDSLKKLFFLPLFISSITQVVTRGYLVPILAESEREKTGTTVKMCPLHGCHNSDSTS